MRRTALFFSLAIALALPPLAAPQNAPASTLAGCLTGQSGNYTLGAVPGGNTYRLTGNLSALNGHQQQLIRLSGRQLAAATGAQLGTFEVQGIQVLANSCTAPLPNRKSPEAVTGKTGVKGTAIPETDTSTAGRVTPGYQTPAGQAQTPGAHRGTEPNPPGKQAPLAPPQWGQVGQNQGTADRSAAAAERAEEEPHHTLGVNATPSYTNPAAPVGSAATRGGGGVATEQPASSGSGMQTANPTGNTTQSSGAGTAETKAQGTSSKTTMAKKSRSARHRRRRAKKTKTTNPSTQQQQNPPSGTK